MPQTKLPIESVGETTIGESYPVPCAWTDHPVVGYFAWVPVFLPAHRDPELKADWMHYHIDFRFLAACHFNPQFARQKERLLASVVSLDHVVAPLQMRRLKCLRASPVFPVQRPTPFSARPRSAPDPVQRPTMNRFSIFFGFPIETLLYFADMERRYRDAVIDLENPVCPHKGICLKGAPVVNGAIICPGHGLAFDCKTGQNVPRHSAKCDEVEL